MASTNGSVAVASGWPSGYTPVEAFFAALGMCTLMLVIVFGNLMVIVVLSSDQKLRLQRHNWLIVSLAVADLLVGLLVMPLTMTYEIIGAWALGNILCELWLAMDVLFVTASILHICVISLDRYWTVTRPLTYPARRTALKIWLMIGAAWVFSLLISLPPLLGWRPQRKPGECEVSNDLGYVLYSALGSFYIPVIVLITAYWRIATVTRQRTQQQLRASFKVRSMLRNSVDLTKTKTQKDRPKISLDREINGKTPLRFVDSDAK
ncbi:Protein OCTR-1 a, partial [Aphelenchoides avenae]